MADAQLLDHSQGKTFAARPSSWISKENDLFSTKTVFVENKGQYGDTVPHHGRMGKIRFGYEGLGRPVLFTSRGLIHLQRKIRSSDDRVITMEWLNANPHVTIIEEDKATGYHTYGMLQTKAGACKRLVYKDLYPGIDVEYSFVGNSVPGFEYRIIARPGANLENIKIRYGGDVRQVRDSSGNLVIRSDIGAIMETTPVCYYADDTARGAREKIDAAHSVKGYNRNFIFPRKYDRRRPVIVDPFVTSTTTALTGLNAGKAMQVDFDNNGDVYIQGGTNELGQIAKFDPTGNLLWTFAGTVPAIGWHYGDNFGGWTVEKTTGNVYVGQGSWAFGSSIIRLNGITGAYDNYVTPPFADNNNGQRGEIWKMRWFCNGGAPQIMIAGGSGGAGSYPDNIALLLLPSTNFISYNITGLTTAPFNQDVSDFVIDPVNNDVYSILASGNTPFVNNRIYKNIYPYTAANQKWNTLSGYSVLHEDNNAPFIANATDINNPGLNTNATNILAVNSSYLFYCDGQNLKALDKGTGAVAGTPVSVPGGAPLMEEGIYADECNNVFVGAANGTIRVYKFNGTTFDDNAAPDITIPGSSGKSVYALAYDKNRNLLYASGDGFVGSFDISAWCNTTSIPASYTISVNTSCSSAMTVVNPLPPAAAIVTYTLLNGNTVVGSNASGIFTGLDPLIEYTIRADINNGCMDLQAVNNFKLSGLDLVVTGKDACGGIVNSGSATAIVSGGIQPYSYSKDGVNFQQDDLLTGLVAGTYTITVKDAAGCTASRDVTIVNNDLVVEAGNDVPICEGTAGQLSGTTNATTFSWTPSASLNDASILTPLASPLTTTKYYLSATNGSCSLTDSVTVVVKPAPLANAGMDDTVCFHVSVHLQGSGGQAYSWTPSIGLSDPHISDPIVEAPGRSITYALQVTDAQGCPSIKRDSVHITVIPDAQVFAGNDTIIARNEPLQLNAIDINGSGFDRYTWSPSYGLNNSTINDPVAILDNPVTYSVTAGTPQGCEATAVIKVTVYQGPDLYVPNAFTPNDDGHNDILKITAVGMKEFRYFIIFNRWGREVFHTANPAVGWDGRLKGSSAESGTFVWTAEAVDYNGQIIRRKGTVLVIR